MVNETSSANYSNFKVYTPNKKEWEQYCSRNLFEDRKPGFREYEKAYVLSLRPHGNKTYQTGFTGGVCDENRKFVCGPVRGFDADGRPLKAAFSVMDSYEFEPDKAEYIDEECIYGGMAISFFGHTLTDSMTFLWYAVEHENKEAKIIFNSPGNSSPSEVFYMLMEEMGIARDRIIVVDRQVIYKVRKLYVPDQSFHFFGTYTNEMIKAYDKAAVRCSNEFKGEVYKKVYLTRNELTPKQGFGEEYFEDFYRKRGYTVIAPEKLPLKEQIAIMANAEEVACLLGSLPIVASAFAQKIKKLIVLARSNDVGTVGIFQKFVQARNINTSYIDVSCNPLPTTVANGVYYVGPTVYWKQYLDENNIAYEPNEVEMKWTYLEEYMKKYACDYSNFKALAYFRIKDLDVFDFVNRMSLVFNGKSLNRADSGTKSKAEYEKEIKRLKTEGAVKVTSSVVDLPNYSKSGKFSKFIILFILDRNLWRDKIKSKLKNHKILLGFAKGVNKVLKKIRILKH